MKGEGGGGRECERGRGREGEREGFVSLFSGGMCLLKQQRLNVAWQCVRAPSQPMKLQGPLWCTQHPDVHPYIQLDVCLIHCQFSRVQMENSVYCLERRERRKREGRKGVTEGKGERERRKERRVKEGKIQRINDSR